MADERSIYSEEVRLCSEHTLEWMVPRFMGEELVDFREIYLDGLPVLRMDVREALAAEREKGLGTRCCAVCGALDPRFLVDLTIDGDA